MTREKVTALIGTWGPPPDLPAKLALAAGMALLALAALGRGRAVLGGGPFHLSTRRFLGLAALAAALLSVGYTATYLRGGPRIIDATTYWLQARALAEGNVAFDVPLPSASFRGRFLLPTADGALAGIFPPGWPLLLALGFGLGAPMVIGPLVAAGLVVATYRLAREMAAAALDERGAEAAARAAALVSVACAAVRYHTADTMAHAATALGIAIALERGLVAARAGRADAALGAGVAIGAVAATRPVSALAIGFIVLLLLWRTGARGALVRRALLGAVPGLLLLALGQRAATGAWLTSSQRAYYALADGPGGCFRWGFGERIGCVFEHGEFVHARLARGYGIVEAAGTTLRRLHLHLRDVANLEPLALLVLAPLARPLRSRHGLAALALVALHALAYAPFYFDGNYPGGGARLLADVLPVEHALMAVGVVTFASRGAGRAPGADVDARIARASFALVSAALVGFATHAVFGHRELAARDGGRPMFEPDVLARTRVAQGLVFVDTDHGFDLAHAPGRTTASGIVVARLREDDHDGLLHERLGKPPTWKYVRGLEEPGKEPVPAMVVPFTPPAPGSSLRFEAESDWPPLAQSGGFAVPTWTDACAGNSRALVLTPEGETAARATLALPVPGPGHYRLTARVVHGARVPFGPPSPVGRSAGTLTASGAVVTWTERTPSAPGGAACEDLTPADLVVPPGSEGLREVPLVLEARGGAVALDRVVLERVP